MAMNARFTAIIRFVRRSLRSAQHVTVSQKKQSPYQAQDAEHVLAVVTPEYSVIPVHDPTICLFGIVLYKHHGKRDQYNRKDDEAASG